MATFVLIAASVVIFFGVGGKAMRPPRRGPAYWWTWSAFGLQLVCLAFSAAGVIPQDDLIIGNVALLPVIILGALMSVRAARRGGSVNIGALLCLAPVAVTSAYILAGYSLLSPVQAALFLTAVIVMPRGGYVVAEIEAALRDSLRTMVVGLLVLAVISPTLIGECRFDKCSFWGAQIGVAGGANALGMSAAFVGVAASLRLPWWRIVPVLLAVLLVVDLCNSRSAIFPLALGAMAVVGERVLRGGSLVTLWRGACLTTGAAAIVYIAVVPVLPDAYTDRGSLWIAARALITERPFLGYGVSYWVRLPQTVSFYSNYAAHNLLLEMLVSFGVLGTLAVAAGIVVSRVSTPGPSLPLWWTSVICWLGGGVTEVLSAPGRSYLLPTAFALPLLLVAGALRPQDPVASHLPDRPGHQEPPERRVVVMSVVRAPARRSARDAAVATVPSAVPSRAGHGRMAPALPLALPEKPERCPDVDDEDPKGLPLMTGQDHAVAAPVGVLEIDPTGHRLQYVRHICDAAGPGGALILVPDGALHAKEYAAHLREHAVPAAPVAATRDRALADAVEHAVARGMDRLVITEADGHLLPLLRLLLRRPRLPLEFRLVLMRTSTIGGQDPLTPASIVKPLLVRLLRLFPRVRIFFLTDALGVVESRRGFGGVPGVRDPVEVGAQTASSERPAWMPVPAPGGVLVGLFGVISPRKNLPLLVAAARAEPRVVLVVGGQVWREPAAFLAEDPDVAALRAEGRFVIVDRLLDPGEFDAALRAVDVAAVLYDNDAPSGILAEACVRGTPVLVPRGAWLERVVRATGIGRATELSATAVADTLTAMIVERDAHVRAARVHSARIGTDHFTTTLLATT